MNLAPETPCAASITERDPADYIFGPELATVEAERQIGEEA